MRNYILTILLKHPIGRTMVENNTLSAYETSVKANNENWRKEVQYFQKLEKVFDKHYQTL